jgi:WD40 repeat protein
MAAALLLLADAGALARGLDPRNLGPLQALSPLAGHLTSVAFSPDGRLCAVGGTAGVVRLYDTATWREEREIAVAEKVASVAFLPDGKRLAVGGEQSLRILNAGDGAEVVRAGGLPGPIRQLAVGRDGSLLTVHEEGHAIAWDAEGRRRASLRGGETSAHSAALSAAGDRAALGVAGGIAVRARRGDGWIEEHGVPLEEDTVVSVAFSGDGRSVLGARLGGPIVVWDLEKRAMTAALVGHGAGSLVALTPDDRYALSGSGDGTIRVWDWRKGAELAQLKHAGVRAIAVHPSGRLFATAGEDRQLRVWGYVRGGAERSKAKGFCGLGMQKSGGAVVVFSLVAGGPAEQAGLQVGDVVRIIGTKAVQTPAEGLEALASYGEGEEVVFEIERKGEERQVRVRMGRKPGAKER